MINRCIKWSMVFHVLLLNHYSDVILGAIASQITSITIVYSSVYSDADQRKHQSSASLAFVWGSHRGPVTSPHKGPVTRKMLPLDDVIMWRIYLRFPQYHVIEYPNSTENHEKLKYYNDLVSTITRDITRYNRITLLWRELMEPSGQSTRLIGCLSMHDDVIKWKHFLRNWPFVRSPVNSPHKGQWCGALMFSLICVWINGWEKTIARLVIWDAIVSIMTSL